jgi:hypothetical protein
MAFGPGSAVLISGLFKVATEDIETSPFIVARELIDESLRRRVEIGKRLVREKTGAGVERTKM